MENRKHLKENYEKAVTAYTKEFCRKHDLDYDDGFWVASVIGDIFCVADYFISFKDMMYDIDNDVLEYKFFQWYEYNVKLGSYDLETTSFDNWLKGKVTYTREDLTKVKEAHKRMEEAQKLFEETLKTLTNKKETVNRNVLSLTPSVNHGTSELTYLLDELRKNKTGGFQYDDTLYTIDEKGEIATKKVERTISNE